MRAYAQVVSTFWIRGSGRKLRGNQNAQVLALYLMTAPHSNLIGLYYLALATICNDTGLTEQQARDAFGVPALREIVSYDFDAELVWLPEGARYQIGELLGPKDKRRPAVERELAMVAGHPFAAEFIERYGEAYGLTNSGTAPKSAPKQQAPKGHPESEDAPSGALPIHRKPPDPALSLVPDSDLLSADQDPPDRSAPRASESPVAATAPANAPPSALGAGELESVTEIRLREPTRLQERARLWVDAPHGEWRSDRQRGAMEAPHPERWPEVVALEAFRARVFPLAPPKDLRHVSDPRVGAVLARFAEGYTPDQLETAVRGAAKDDLFQRSPQHQNFATLFKSSAQVDRLVDLAGAPAAATERLRRTGAAPVQPSNGADGFAGARGRK